MDTERLKMEAELKVAGYKHGLNNEGYYSWTDPTGEIEIAGTAFAHKHMKDMQELAEYRAERLKGK